MLSRKIRSSLTEIKRIRLEIDRREEALYENLAAFSVARVRAEASEQQESAEFVRSEVESLSEDSIPEYAEVSIRVSTAHNEAYGLHLPP